MDLDRQELRNKMEKIGRDAITGSRTEPYRGSFNLPILQVLNDFENAALNEGIHVKNLGHGINLENPNPKENSESIKQIVYIYGIPYYDDSKKEINPFICRVNVIAHQQGENKIGVTSFLTCDLRKIADKELKYRMDEKNISMVNSDGIWKFA